MVHTVRALVFASLALGLFVARTVRAAESPAVSDWPAAWRAAWTAPPAELRPLQIVHGLPANQATPAAMEALKKLGLGGIVTNVNFADYMVSEAHWATLMKAVDACKQVGLVVWLYDEDGYPSGAAGGLVLKTDPAFEAQALVYDPTREPPFAVRPAYEHTHASNNFYAARRYPNLIDAEAIRCFIGKTHAAYWRRLGPHFGKTIRAIFTDEPSLMAVNIGQLPEGVRKNVRVVDPPDENVKPLPSVPWSDDLAERYRERYGEDLPAARRSLFVGDTEADRRIRRRFWALIADLIAERYFGAIQGWCGAHHIASSGHTLWEERPIHHVPLEGDALKVLAQMDIPGLDMLSSDPTAVIHSGWLTAGLPMSAALLTGRRRVMTEVSDFVQTMAKKPPATVAAMEATAAWQAAFGVTEFTLYYNRHKRKPAEYRAYGDFVGRLNALLREATPDPRVLLYYPIYDLWAEYKPVAQKLAIASQSKRAQQIQGSFLALGQRLVRSQIPFALTDHAFLAVAKVEHGRLVINGQQFGALVLPAEVALPEPATRIVDRFKAGGGVVYRHKIGRTLDVGQFAQFSRSGPIRPASDPVVVGSFLRDGRRIVLAVNVSPKPYDGKIRVKAARRWQLADPATGKVTPAKGNDDQSIAVSLPPQSAILLVAPLISAEERLNPE